MAPPAPAQQSHSGRRLIVSLLVLVGVVAALAVGLLVMRRGKMPIYHHSPNAINTGKSLLYLNAPSGAARLTQLTMVRTSDGAILWHYTISGALSTGATPTIGEALAAGQAVEIVNGDIYFVADPDPQGSPGHALRLMALRASDGAVLWQQPVSGALVTLFGVSDGVICLQVTQQQGSELTASDLEGYSATDGSRVWQRQPDDIFGAQRAGYARFGASLMDGVIYVTDGYNSATAYALLANNGETLWTYTQADSALPAAGVSAVAADDGVVVLYSAAASVSGQANASLIGIQESSGAVRWRYQLPSLAADLPFGGPHADGIFTDGGVLYAVSTASDASLWLNSLRISDGHLLWRVSLATGRHVLWDMTVGDGGVYADFTLPWVGMHPTYDGLTLAAVGTTSGTLRWQYQPPTHDFTHIEVTSDVILLATKTTLTGLRPGDGTLLWQHTLTTGGALSMADDMGIFSSVVSSGPNTWTGTLCGVRPATGAMRWCKQFATGLAAVVPGP